MGPCSRPSANVGIDAGAGNLKSAGDGILRTGIRTPLFDSRFHTVVARGFGTERTRGELSARKSSLLYKASMAMSVSQSVDLFRGRDLEPTWKYRHWTGNRTSNVFAASASLMTASAL